MSSERQQELKGLAAAYALGALDPAEAREFEAWLVTSPEARRELAEFQEVQALLALGQADQARPAPDLRARVLARATGEKVMALPPRPKTSRAPWIALAASLIGVVALGLNQRQLQLRLAQQDSAIAALEQSVATRDQRLAEREATLNALLEPGTTLTQLVATGEAPPVIQFFWNRRNNVAIIHVSSLRPAGQGRVYQLWFIPKDGKPIPSVTFNSEESGHALVRQISVPADQGQLTAVALTEEPAGGSLQPTTTPFLAGTI